MVLSFLCLTVLLVHLLSRGIARPVKRLSDAMIDLSLGNYNIHFDVGGCMEMLQLSETLNYKAGELRQLEKQRRNLIAEISHDLRTPLASIVAYCELLRDYPEERKPGSLQAILDEANWLSGLVNNLLQISKLQDNIESLDISSFGFTEELEHINSFKPALAKEGVQN